MATYLQSLAYPANSACNSGSLAFATVTLTANATECQSATTGKTTCSTDASAFHLYDSSVISSCVSSLASPDPSFNALNKQYARLSIFADSECTFSVFAFYAVVNECYYVRPDLSGLFYVSNNTLHWDYYTGSSCKGEVLQNYQTYNLDFKCVVDPAAGVYRAEILGAKTEKPKPNKVESPEYNKEIIGLLVRLTFRLL